MFCKVRLMASTVLVILVLAALTEDASAAKGKNNRRKGDHMRLKRTTKLENVTLSANFPKYNGHIHEASFRNRSLSPWIYKKDFDANRYPSSIDKAECVSKQCFKDPDLNTRLVKQEMLVLRKKKSRDDKIIYHVEKLLVPVACVCVRPEVVHA
ncbi:interleukin-17F-like [Amblyraja radiata]|uniref:interleukin-17F-like n=1 Tax=Amblyraja radiata TaxID=386614 RepID=UPI001402AD3E|nr:interleukin-17F-like [Amblyraja radiata]